MEVPEEAVASKIYGVRIISPNHEVVFRFKEPVGAVLYPEKWVEYYLKRCRELGVDLKLGVNVGLAKSENEMDFLTYHNNSYARPDILKTDALIAADGANSQVRRFLELPGMDPMDLHLGYEHTIDACEDWDPGLVHMVFNTKLAPKGYCWYFQEGKDRARVGLGIPKGLNENPKMYFDRYCEAYPEFKKPPHKVLGGQIPTAPIPDSNVFQNVLFVGDAGFFCSPLHGGGIGFAAMSGAYAGTVVANGLPLKEYDKMWKKNLGKLLKRHYILKQLLYSWDNSKFDRFVKSMQGYEPKSLNPNTEIFNFVKNLIRKDPGMVPFWIVQALKMRA